MVIEKRKRVIPAGKKSLDGVTVKKEKPERMDHRWTTIIMEIFKMTITRWAR